MIFNIAQLSLTTTVLIGCTSHIASAKEAVGIHAYRQVQAAALLALPQFLPVGKVFLVTPFRTNGKLTLSISEFTGIPQHYERDITLERGHKTTSIQRIEDLAGRVQIRSTSEALSFVRMMTSPQLADSMRSKLVEVMPASFLNDALYYGAPQQFRVYQGMFSWGVAPKTWLTKSHWKAPVISANGSGWVVTRWLCDYETESIEVVREIISRDGGYQRSVLRHFPVDPSDQLIFYRFRLK